MTGKNGLEYPHNYDVVVKWLAEALRGQTLEVIGVETGHIVDVFGFEPVDIAVKTGRVDVMFRDDAGKFFHLEEQRNLRRIDLYRFAAHHFMGARKWGDGLTDIVLASGNVFAGEKAVTTESGVYRPVVVDFSERDGEKRLEEIKDQIREGTFQNWLELVFLPLYGKMTGELREEFVENAIRFETELFKARMIPATFLAAVLIMSNKIIPKIRLEEIWEEIKMLDILEIAHEKGRSAGLEEGKSLGIQEGKSLGIQEGKSLGIQEGKSLGIQEGKNLGIQEGKSLGIKEGKAIGILENTREMLFDALAEKFDVVPKAVLEKIRSIDDVEILKVLFRKVFKYDDIEQFEGLLARY